jgi:phage recombination protein Bet
MTSTEIERSPAGALTLRADQTNWSPDQLAVVRQIGMEGASPEELRIFLHVCQRTGLDPFARQIYGIMRNSWNPSTRRTEPKLTIQTGIDGFRLVGQRPDRVTGKPSGFEGRVGPEWCGDDGEWKGVWVSDKPPTAARVGIWKHGYREPIWAVAHFREFAQTKSDGGLMDMWKRMPANQLAKCAEAAAYRGAFPQDLSGIYAPEEMGAADVADAAARTVDADPSIPAEKDPAELQIAGVVQSLADQASDTSDVKTLSSIKQALIVAHGEAAQKGFDQLVAHIAATGSRVTRKISDLNKVAEETAAAEAKSAQDAADREAEEALAREAQASAASEESEPEAE